MKIYEIWSTGYVATGESGGPTFHGKVEAESFQEACNELASMSYSFDAYYNEENLTFWGCRLYETRKEALKNTPKRKEPEKDMGPAHP